MLLEELVLRLAVRVEQTLDLLAVRHIATREVAQLSAQSRMLVSDGKSSIRLLDLNTLVLTEKYYPVEDPNFLTQDEARRIVELTKLNWTFTDFELIPAGVKSKIISEAIRSVIEK
jgi:hypothetical protein